MAYINQACIDAEKCDHPTYRYIIKELANCEGNLQCDPTAVQNIVEKMKAVNADEYKYFKSIKDTLQSFAIQINLKLKPGQIDAFPVQYFKQKNRGEGEAIGYDSWEFNEYSLEGHVIDLKTDKKNQLSIASTPDYKIILGDKDESHSVDIISRRANETDPFDRLRINITGRIEVEHQDRTQKYVAPIAIKIPGLPVVNLNVLIQPSLSTFTELDYVP